MPSCCQFCLRGVRDTNLRRVCGACRKTERNACLFCGLPYQGGHACALNVPKCVHCRESYWLFRLALPLDAGHSLSSQSARGLCGKCKASGYALCTKSSCERIAKDPGKHVFCDQHHPLPASSLWRKGVMPIGGPPFLNTRSWRSFGIEIEAYQDRDRPAPTGWRPPQGWAKGTDGSISPPYRTESAEFRSMPFFGDRGLAQLVRDVGHIRAGGWTCNKSCGLHVHISLMDDCGEEDFKSIFKFAKTWETEVLQLVAPSRRENSYCRKLSSRLPARDRYRWLNFLALREHGTVEVRLHSGSTHPIRVKQWVTLMLRFIESGIRLGRQRVHKKGDLFTTLGLSPRDTAYWKARMNRFARDQQERERTTQMTTTQTPQAAPIGG